MRDELNKWLTKYLKFRYGFAPQFFDINNSITKIRVQFIKDHVFCAIGELNNIEKVIDLIRKIKMNDHIKEFRYIVMVVLNNRRNVNFLIMNWNIFCAREYVKIMFVNIEKNKVWEIVPYVHNLIADKTNLRKGILSLYHGFG